MKILKCILLLLILSSSLQAKYPFEKYFKRYSAKYFNKNFDYYWFIAQSKQESAFNPNAISYVGAEGLMQIMPNTWNDLTNNIFDVKSPKYNIKYGILYDRKMWNIYKAPRPFIDRISFMLGSYNAGAGNIIKAQKLAEKNSANPNIWHNIINTLPKITGKHSKETILYVKKIKQYYYEMAKTRFRSFIYARNYFLY